MIANARMYSIDTVTAACWRTLLEWVIARAGIDCEVIDYPPPQVLSALWAREDLACAFMCGYPLAHAAPAPAVLAAIKPSPTRYRHESVYWTDLVVRADSAFFTASDVLGKRLAYTSEDSQSGYQAPRRFFAAFAGAENGRLFAPLVGPLVTPRNVVQAVLEGNADVGPLDSYAHDLMRKHQPALTASLRTIATTARTPIPPLVAAAGTPIDAILRLRGALVAAAGAKELKGVLEALLIEDFAVVDPADYGVFIEAALQADRLGYPRLA